MEKHKLRMQFATKGGSILRRRRKRTLDDVVEDKRTIHEILAHKKKGRK